MHEHLHSSGPSAIVDCPGESPWRNANEKPTGVVSPGNLHEKGVIESGFALYDATEDAQLFACSTNVQGASRLSLVRNPYGVLGADGLAENAEMNAQIPQEPVFDFGGN